MDLQFSNHHEQMLQLSFFSFKFSVHNGDFEKKESHLELFHHCSEITVVPAPAMKP